MFAYIVDKVKKVEQGWKQKHLTHGRKEVLLKSIALAMPIFSMNIFRLPKKICDEIIAILARFWWGSLKDYIGMLGKYYIFLRKKGV